MKRSIIILFLIALTITSIAQQQTFDITNFIPPKNWDKDIREGLSVSFTTTNNQNNSYCRITVYASVDSKGGINQDFESEWKELVLKNHTITDSVRTSAIQKYGDWNTKTGIATFKYNKADNIIILSTSSGFEKATSILIIYNNTEYDSSITNFLSRVSYKKAINQTPIVAENKKNPLPIAGKWARSISLSYSAGGMNSGYTKSIYEFKGDNSYTFTQRTWGMTASYIYIVKETGILKMNNNQVTLIPQKSVIESWTHNGDALVKLAATNKRTLETTIYQFVIRYDNSMKDWDLVLQANNETVRDGKFGGVQPYPNGWYYSKRFSDYDLTAPKIFK